MSGLISACACLLLLSQDVIAADQVVPDVSTWIAHEAPEHGFTFKAPADWERSDPKPDMNETIIYLRHPERAANCLLTYTPARPGTKLDMDGYLKYMTDERVIELNSREFSSVTLHDKKPVPVSGRKGLLTIVSGNTDSRRLTLMTVSTIKDNTIYALQCLTAPERIPEIYPIFLFMGATLEIEPS